MRSVSHIPFKPALFSSDRGHVNIDMLVLHYTAGPSLADCMRLFRSPQHPVSCHYVVGLNGSMVQMVYDQDCAWHCGVSKWAGRDRCNPYSLGIEIVNWGQLRKIEDEFYCWPDDYTTPYIGASPVFEDAHWWAPYPDEQVRQVTALSNHLIRKYHLPIKNVVRHSDIAPGRKIDPGPAFPWTSFIDDLDEI